MVASSTGYKLTGTVGLHLQQRLVTTCGQSACLDGHDGLLNLYFVSSQDKYLTVFVAKRRGQTTRTTPKRLRSQSTMNIMNIN